MKQFKSTTPGMTPNHKSIQEILMAWDHDVSEPVMLKLKQLAARRTFLGQSVALLGVMAMPASVAAKMKDNKAVATTDIPDSPLSQPWLTLAEVQQHLFPREAEINNTQKNNTFSPGAKDINAIGYLYTMLHTPDADEDERKFVIKGVTWLDGMANTMAGAPFMKLKKQDRERILKKISESNSGESWLSTLLRYIFEALLTDPVYGGNTNSAGWQWLEHQPGFPRPPQNKKYWLLRANNSQPSGAIKTGKAK